MSNRIHRRSFLGVAAAAAGAGLAPRQAPAIEPIQRNGTAKFKFSLAAYSYRNLLSGSSPQLTFDDFLADCAGMGLDGAEPTSYYFPKDVTPEYLRRMKGLAFRLGLDISGTAIGNDFCHPPGPERDAQMALAKRWIDNAEILDAPVIRIFSGRRRGDQTEDEARRLAVEGIEEACDYAGKHGIFLALENHGGLTATVESMLELIHDVKSPWFGVNLDSGNFHGEDPYGDLARIAPYTLNVQVKITVASAGGGRVPTDFKRLAQLLTEAGYRGYIVLEYEEKDDPRQACPKYIEQLRTAFS